MFLITIFIDLFLQGENRTTNRKRGVKKRSGVSRSSQLVAYTYGGLMNRIYKANLIGSTNRATRQKFMRIIIEATNLKFSI